MSLNFGGEDRRMATDEAMRDPQVGDRFSEMLNFWLYVIHRDGDYVVTLETNPPAELPRDGKLRAYTIDDFRKRFSYGSIEGYWVMLEDRGHDVAGWYESKIPEALTLITRAAF